jgi:hypothetical protein
LSTRELLLCLKLSASGLPRFYPLFMYYGHKQNAVKIVASPWCQWSTWNPLLRTQLAVKLFQVTFSVMKIAEGSQIVPDYSTIICT